jgi:hypothetical protein
LINAQKIQRERAKRTAAANVDDRFRPAGLAFLGVAGFAFFGLAAFAGFFAIFGSALGFAAAFAVFFAAFAMFVVTVPRWKGKVQKGLLFQKEL